MATIKYFEDLDIWQKAQDLGAIVFKLAEDNAKINKDYSFKDQFKRAALSISNNIAEGFEYNNNNDFHRYLRIAKGSCGEVRNCLLFSIKINYCSSEEVSELVIFSRTLGSQIGGMMKYLKEHKLQTSKSVTRNS